MRPRRDLGPTGGCVSVHNINQILVIREEQLHAKEVICAIHPDFEFELLSNGYLTDRRIEPNHSGLRLGLRDARPS
jgi:hypothetical protein